MVLLLQNYFLLQTLIKPLMLPLMAGNISVIKLMFIEDDDVTWCKELYQCIWKFYMEIEELQYISKNQSVKKIL